MRTESRSWLVGPGSALVYLVAVLVFSPSSVSSELQKPLAPTSESFEGWRERKTPVYTSFYMFNITNVDDIISGKNVSIRVEQLGPYVYEETETKTNISWHDNGTVEFYNLRHWHFQPDMSNGSLTDEIVNINPVIMTVSNQIQYGAYITQMALNMLMKTVHQNLFLKASVSSWLFDGIEDSVLRILGEVPHLVSNASSTTLDDKFGWYYGLNGSTNHEESFLMNTGAADINKLGNLEKWKFSDRTVYRDECGEVKGLTGELWAPEVGHQNVTIFVPDICTYLELPMDKEVEEEGVKTVQYAADTTIFDNGHTDPKKACYCNEVRDRDCLPSGALNVSTCLNAPAFISLPHFLHSDSYYTSKIEGLKPTEDMNFRVSVEKSTGKLLSVTEQLQMNFLVRHSRGISIVNILSDSDVLVPMFWYKREVRNTSN